MKISPRLELILNHLLPGQPVWDICCDHGLLGRSAIRKNLFSEVHFVDQVDSIMQRLQSEIKKFRPEFILNTGDDYIYKDHDPQKLNLDLDQKEHSLNLNPQIPVYLWLNSAHQTAQFWSGNIVIAGVGSQLILEFLLEYVKNLNSKKSIQASTFFLCPQKDIKDIEEKLPLGLRIQQKIHFKEKHRDRILYLVVSNLEDFKFL